MTQMRQPRPARHRTLSCARTLLLLTPTLAVRSFSGGRSRRSRRPCSAQSPVTRARPAPPSAHDDGAATASSCPERTDGGDVEQTRGVARPLVVEQHGACVRRLLAPAVLLLLLARAARRLRRRVDAVHHVAVEGLRERRLAEAHPTLSNRDRSLRPYSCHRQNGGQRGAT